MSGGTAARRLVKSAFGLVAAGKRRGQRSPSYPPDVQVWGSGEGQAVALAPC